MFLFPWILNYPQQYSPLERHLNSKNTNIEISIQMLWELQQNEANTIICLAIMTEFVN